MSKADGHKKRDKETDGELKLIFNGGSSTQFMQARPALVRAFVIEECWIYVNYHPELGAGPCELPALGAAIVENSFTDPMPLLNNVVVAGIIARKIQDRRDLAQFQIDQLAALPGGAMDANTRIVRIMDIGNLLATDILKIEESRSQIEKDLLTKDHGKKQGGALKVFTKCLGPEPLAHIAEELDAGNYRAAWVKLNRRYNVTVGGHANVQVILQQLNDAQFNAAGDSIIEHIHDMKMLAMQTREAGVGAGIEDAMLLQFILRSIEKSRDKDFMVDVEHINRHPTGMTLAEAEAVFQRTQARKDAQDAMRQGNRKVGQKDKRLYLAEVQAAISLLEKEKNNSKGGKKPKAVKKGPDMSKWSEAKKALQCTKCGNRGHLEVDCWSDKICAKCGKTGHIPLICRAVDNPNTSSDKKVKIADMWKNKK
jgi:hypothetical protein